MAAYTSTQNGNWNDHNTWGGLGNFPGDTPAQDDTAAIAAGHTVTLNIATHAGTVSTVSIAATGKVIVSANFTPIDEFVGAWTVNGELEWAKAAGTYQLTIAASITFNNGSDWDMDATGAGVKQTLALHPSIQLGETITVNAGATVICQGRAVTTYRTLSGQALVGGGGAQDLIPDASTDWVTGDYIYIMDAGSDNECLQMTVAGPAWNVTPANNHDDNCRVWHVTRSCVIKSANAAADIKIDVNSGAGEVMPDFDWVEFERVLWDDFDILQSPGTPFYGCTMHGNTQDYLVNDWDWSQGVYTIERCLFATRRFGLALVSALGGNEMGEFHFVDCGFTTEESDGSPDCIASVSLLARFEGCDLCGGDCFEANSTPNGELVDSYLWGFTIGLDVAKTYGRTELYRCVLGEDRGGNAQGSATCIALTENYSGRLFLYDCKLAGTTEVSLAADVPEDTRILSVHHDQTTGYHKEWQKYGTVESNAAEDRSAPYCHAITPTSDAAGEEVVYRRKFLVDAGDNVTVTAWMKNNNVLATAITVELGDEDCGLGGIAAGTPIVLNNVYAQKTITFNNAADRDGSFELLIKVQGDAAPVTTIAYIDDIEVAYA